MAVAVKNHVNFICITHWVRLIVYKLPVVPFANHLAAKSPMLSACVMVITGIVDILRGLYPISVFRFSSAV